MGNEDVGKAPSAMGHGWSMDPQLPGGSVRCAAAVLTPAAQEREKNLMQKFNIWSSTAPKSQMFASTANICQHIFDFSPKYSGQKLGEKLRIVYGKQILLTKISI